MADLYRPGDDETNRIAANAEGAAVAIHESLRCQWCSVPLAPGTTTCPTCGSAGVPDPRMSVAGLTDVDFDQPAPDTGPTPTASNAPKDEAELVEWWRYETVNGETVERPAQTMDFAEVEQRRTRAMLFIGGAVVICTALGWLIGPLLLEAPFERITGATVEQRSDLRTMGTVGGFIVGMFLGALAGWVIWADK